METEPKDALFSTSREGAFAARFAREIRDAAREFSRSPLSYLRVALLPARIKDWLPLRFANSLLSLVAHPLAYIAGLFRRERQAIGFIYPPSGRSVTFVNNAFSTKEAGRRRRDLFVRTLMAVAACHAVLIGVLVYLTVVDIFSPYINVKVVSKPYKPFDPDLVAQLYAPARKMESTSADKVASLEAIQERERKRREEAERRRREEAERRKAEQEKAAREKAAREKAEREKAEREAQAKAEEAGKQNDSDQLKFGELNENAIKDLVGKIYGVYKAGEIELKDFSVTASFKIARDGSLPRSSIAITQSSGDSKKDNYALQILWLIGESHALGPLWELNSNSVRFDLKDDTARLTITGFGPTPDWVNQKAAILRLLFWGLSKTQKNTNAAELLSMVKINTMNNRINLDLTVSRARASEMMRDQFKSAANNE
jgi:hypothetical protein